VGDEQVVGEDLALVVGGDRVAEQLDEVVA
jgi:hypothetical protein